jgi:hypothetical protein
MTIEPCKLLAAQLGELFTCSSRDPYIRIRTPFFYPDGDVIDLFARKQDDAILLTDLGESLRWLRTQTASTSRRTENQQELIRDVCQTHRVELFKGMLVIKNVHPTGVAEGVVRLGQTALRIGDIGFTMRRRTVLSVTDDVEKLLRANELAFERGKRVRGGFGREYRIDFDVQTAHRHSLVQVLSAANRRTASSSIDHTYTVWSDLHHIKSRDNQLRFVSLFDDTADVWASEDLRLLESVSDHLLKWSKPDEITQALAA